MTAVGIALMWAGYSFTYYGLDQMFGGNDRFVALIWPGMYGPVAKDQPGQCAGASGQQAPIPQATKLSLLCTILPGYCLRKGLGIKLPSWLP